MDIAAAILVAALAAAPAATAALDAQAMDARGEELLAALREGRTVHAARTLDPALRAELTPTRLTSAWRQLISSVGRPTGWSLDPASSSTRRVYEVACERGRVRATLDFSDAGEVAGLTFSAPAAPAAGRGQHLATGQAPLLVGATLLLPPGVSKAPAALLLGDLDADRDGAHGTGRAPLRELAEALAARGVASLRLERHTVAWPGSAGPESTIQDEVVEDAVAALRALRARPDVDGTRLFVVGHGLGGLAAPEVASRVPGVTAVALLGAPAHSFAMALVEEARAARKLPPGELARHQKLGERALANRLEDDETFHDRAAGFWRDLSTRDAAGDLRRLGRPVLVARGERDLLCNPDDLPIWRAGLAGVEVAIVETLPGVDHDLAAPGADHALPAALAHVADFLLAAPRGPGQLPAAAVMPGAPGRAAP